MAGNNAKKPQLNSELALEIERLLAEENRMMKEAKDAADNSDQPAGQIGPGINGTGEAAAAADENTEAVQSGTVPNDSDAAAQNGTVSDDNDESALSNTVSGDNDESALSNTVSGDNDETVQSGTVPVYNDESPQTSVEDGGRKNRKYIIRIILIAAAVAAGLFVIGVAVTYYIESTKYDSVFFKNTYINNVDVSDKTPDEVRTYIKELCKDYSISISSRYRDDENINASDIGLIYVTGDEIDTILEQQEPLKFYFEQNRKKEYEIPAMLDLDDKKLAEVCGELTAFDDGSATEPANAYIGDYDPNASEYVIVPETDGNRITDKSKAIDYISRQILSLNSICDLEEIGEQIYPRAEIRSDDQNLNTDKSRLDKYVSTKITYVDSDIVLDGSIIKDWLIVDNSFNVTLDEDKIRSFVDSLADHYDTVGKERPLRSWYGNDTVVSGGTFGWELDREAEFNELKQLIPESTVAEREPVFSKRGIVHGENDWGDTYVEVNLAKQHLFFIKEGELVVETDIVSGGLQRKCPTPEGVYCINYKARNAVLRGPRQADGTYQWESPVSYWMPFNKGIGLHDASWRGSFGGNIYKYNGSHGCVNLPKKNAKIIFENIETGVPVLVYSDDFVIAEKETEAETETQTKAAKKKAVKNKQTQAETQPQTQPETQPQTQPETQPETQAETQPVTEAVTQGEIGPGIPTQPDTQPGPGVSSQTDDQVTYNAENLPGEMQ